MANSNKTEQPTPHHRQQARRRGQVARSRDLPGALALAAAGGVLFWLGGDAAVRWRGLLRSSLSLASTEAIGIGSPLPTWCALEVVRATTPVLGAGLVLALAGGISQGGMVFAADGLQPKFDRLSPAKKLQQMFSLAGLSGLLKSLLPLAAIAAVGVGALHDHWGELERASFLSLPGLAALLLAMTIEVGWKSALILLAWSGIDYLLAWRKLEGELRMTRQELRDDFKETEGSPETKSRIRRIQRSLRRQQLLRATQTATVVVTNPTHYAVALRFELDMAAPVVVAKGRDLLAQRIKEVARWHSIPVLENPPLAQTLYRAVEVGQEIPAKLYAAVAEILVLVYQAQARMRRPAAGSPSATAGGPR